MLCTMDEQKMRCSSFSVLLLALEKFTNWVGRLTVGRGQITELFVSVQPHTNARDMLLIRSGTELFYNVLLAEFEWFVIFRFQSTLVQRIIRIFSASVFNTGFKKCVHICVNFQIEKDT